MREKIKFNPCVYCAKFEHGQCQAAYIHERFELKTGLNPKHYQIDRLLGRCADIMNGEE